MLGNLISLITKPQAPKAPVQAAPVINPIKAEEKKPESDAPKPAASISTPMQTTTPTTQAALVTIIPAISASKEPQKAAAQPANTESSAAAPSVVATPVETEMASETIADARQRAIATQDSIRLETIVSDMTNPADETSLQDLVSEKADDNKSFGGYSRQTAQQTLAA